jgi:hypothetical protein
MASGGMLAGLEDDRCMFSYSQDPCSQQLKQKRVYSRKDGPHVQLVCATLDQLCALLDQRVLVRWVPVGLLGSYVGGL